MVKINVDKLKIVLFGLIGIYPIVPFNASSTLLILFIVTILYLGKREQTFDFSFKKIKLVLIYTLYFFFLALSILYSSNKGEAIKRIIQFLPLLVVPAALCFSNIYITNKLKDIIFMSFTWVNVIFTFLVMLVFFKHVYFQQIDFLNYLFDYDKFQFVINENIPKDYPFVHKAYFSMGFVICAIYSLDMVFEKGLNNKRQLIFHSLLFFYFLFWIFYAFSFPNIIALVVSVIILLFFRLKSKSLIAALALFAIATGALFVIKSFDKDVERGLNILSFRSLSKETELLDPRLEVYESLEHLISSFTKNQYLFGLGVGDVQDALNKSYQHNYRTKSNKNLALFNQELDNPYWFKNNIYINQNALFAIDGTLSADYIYDLNRIEKVSHNISKIVKIREKGVYTLSVYAKRESNNFLTLRFGDINQRAVFDIKNGTIAKSFNLIDYSIEPFGNDWFRCAISVYLEIDSPAIIGLSNNNHDYLFQLNYESGLYVWGVQIEYGRLSNYTKNETELISIVKDNKYNTHNNFLYFLLATGILGLVSFIIFILKLIIDSATRKNIIFTTFSIVLVLNFLTENIIQRHWGLMFMAFMLAVYFGTNNIKPNYLK